MKKKISKRYKKLSKEKDSNKLLSFEDAIKLVKKNCTTKFDESIDVSIMLNLKNKSRCFM